MGVLRLSKSKVNSYLTCPFKYYLGYELSLWPLKKSIAMINGLVTHKIIEIYLKRLEEGKPFELAGTHGAVWTQYPLRSTDADQGEYQEAYDQSMALAGLFMSRVPTRPFMVEHSFELPVVNLATGQIAEGVSWRGIMDHVNAREDGELVVDIKTKAKRGNQFDARTAIELTGYAYAYRMIAEKRECGVSPVNLIKTKEPDVQSLEDYRDEEDFNGFFDTLVDVEEKDGSWCFKGSFIDLERGSTVERLFRKSIPKTAPGKYEGDRWVDMVFQKAQSQALRNVIFSSLPRWLKERAVEKARDAALRNIETYGVEKAKEMILLPLVKLGVATSQVEIYLGKTRNEWDKEDLLLLRNVVVQVRNGDATLEEVFSSGKTPKANPGHKAAQTGSPKSNQSGSSPATNITQSQPQLTTQTQDQTARPQEGQSLPSTGPISVSGKGDRLKDLYTKLFRLGLKDLLEPYKGHRVLGHRRWCCQGDPC